MHNRCCILSSSSNVAMGAVYQPLRTATSLNEGDILNKILNATHYQGRTEIAFCY